MNWITKLKDEDYHIDFDTGSVCRGVSVVAEITSPIQISILRYFSDNPGIWLKKDSIICNCWPDAADAEYISDDTFFATISKLRRIHAKVDESIESKRGMGYRYLGSRGEELDTGSPKEPAAETAGFRTAYYEKLWTNHCKGVLRDQVATGNVRELIDFFVLPSLASTDGESVRVPFGEPGFSKLLVAGSGFGKSTLLDMMLLCNVADLLAEAGSPVLSSNSQEKMKEYGRIWEALSGDAAARFFPVFIHSDRANAREYASVLDLAEANDVPQFLPMVEEAEREGSLLFLIDSIDEVESDNLNDYLSSIKIMLSRYPKASAVFASRFLGKKTLPFGYEVLQIKELTADGIRAIASAMLSANEADRFITRMQDNPYLASLARNPFMLMTMLESKGDRLLHHLLESIVNAIIDRRWEKHRYDISSEDIRLLLGFLACRFVFEDRTTADVSEIRQCFIRAGDDLRLHGVSYDVPSQNIDYFLKTLSSQSGILNVVSQHHVEKFLFQDELVKCWLAANYITRIINESSEIHDREGENGIWANTYWLDSFVRSLSPRTSYLSASAVDVLVMTLVMCSETSGQDIQKSILYFLVCREAVSLDAQERKNIASGFRDLIGNSFGENTITNLSDSEAMQIISRILNARSK